MLLGAVLAASTGNPFEGALLLFLFALSGAMERFALRRTQSAITALRELAPTVATVLQEGRARVVPLKRVVPHDVVLV
ncbi:MAG: heavy metal translocating P-type ATPase, partial [Planctomycetota bacterium]